MAGGTVKQHFTEALENAQGRSEFVIVAVIDIRGFSRFSTRHESPDIAMFIKRFYLRLIKDYFPNANFVKPTGDGLLMTFIYDENSLKDVAQQVIEACLKVLVDFPTLCKDDPMINFRTPDAIGVGIARGTACCMFADQEILDYSGHLLNLASRLNDLARPSGVVIDGAFLHSIIPENRRPEFKTQNVYVRSIAEDKSIPVFYLEKHVKIPASALVPLSNEKWVSVVAEYSYTQLKKLADKHQLNLPSRVRSSADIRITLTFPDKKLKGITRLIPVKDFTHHVNATQDVVELNMKTIIVAIEAGKMPQRARAKFKVDYVPK
jgi:class 3 adenylate cyclase